MLFAIYGTVAVEIGAKEYYFVRTIRLEWVDVVGVGP